MRSRSSAEQISELTASPCRLRNSSKIAATALRSPASDSVAASINRLVTPLMAETTTTTLLSRAPDRMISTTLLMQDASATEVPPNFITRSGFFRLLRVRPWLGCSPTRSSETGLDALALLPFVGRTWRRGSLPLDFLLLRLGPPRYD